MAWDTTMITMLRVLIQDFDGVDFSDDRLKQILAVSAQYVDNDIILDQDYTIDVITPDISPDPTTSSPVDDVFVNFVVLRAACMIDQGSLRCAAFASGLEARCGPTVMKTVRRMEGFGTLIDKGYCRTYEELKHQYDFGNSAFCKGILSPFINETFIPSNYGTQGHFNISNALRTLR